MSVFDAVTTTTAPSTTIRTTLAAMHPVNLSSVLESLAALQPMQSIVTPTLTPQSSITSILSPPPPLDILLSTPLITVPFSTMTITTPTDSLLSPLSLTSQLSPLSLASNLSLPSSSQTPYNQITGSSNISPLLSSGLGTFPSSQQLSPMDAGPSAFSRRQSAPESMLSSQVQEDRRRFSDFTVHSLLRRPSVGGVEQRKNSIGGRKPRTIYGAKQTEVLEEVFSESNYMVGPERELLAQRLGLSEAQVRVWFQNRRSKKRKRLQLEQAMHDRKCQNSNIDM